jgi:type II secretory pathway pseudopilin PulG
MGNVHGTRRRLIANCAALAAVVLLFASPLAAQVASPSQPDAAISQELNKYPGLLPELGQLLDKLKNNVQLPPPRTQSDLLPLLPGDTTYYAALPNYGEPARQALTIFRDELKQSAVLRDWWQHSDVAKSGPQLEHAIEEFSTISNYLGDEVVFSGETGASNASLVVVAQVRKPGLKDLLQKMVNELGANSSSTLRILDPKELAAAKSTGKGDGFVVVVRPDFVIAASSLAVARNFNTLLQAKEGSFASAPFGERLARTYRDGTTGLAGADLHQIISQSQLSKSIDRKTLERLGFDNVEYAVWNHKKLGGQSISESELSFTSARKGLASWLAAPAPLGSLSFVSPKTPFVLGLQLKNLGEIFEVIKSLSADSKSPAFVMLPAMEQAMHISLKDDVFGQFPGEIALGLDKLDGSKSAESKPIWTAILRVPDADHLQKALDQIFQTLPVQAKKFDEGEIHYHSLMVPSQPKPAEIFYAFTDGYAIVAPTRETIAEAIRLHQSGESLAKSAQFFSTVPPGYSADTSMLLYEEASAMTRLRLGQLSPEIAKAFSQVPTESTPVTFRAYGEPNAIRGVSTSAGADAGAVLVIAALAIPNLLRARIAANESSGVATVRTVNTAQIAYAASYPHNGYARSLAALGPDPRGPKFASPLHAGLLDSTLGGPDCGAGKWCEKSGYRFSLSATCPTAPCKEYVVVATPDSGSTGTRSYCSTSDGVIRFRVGSVLTSPTTAAECKRWRPLQ